MKRVAGGIVLAALLLATGGCMQNQGPRSSGKPALDTSKERDLSYMIEREVDGQPVVVHGDDLEFRNGERFRVRFRPGFKAYIYVANRGSHQDSYHLLFPANGADHDQNPLDKGTATSLPPAPAWLKLDQSPGDEYLTLIASTVPLEEFGNTTEIPREKFDSELTDIERQYQPTSSRRFQDGDWTKYFAARDGDLVLVAKLALRHEKQ
jgi:hypothetical protein